MCLPDNYIGIRGECSPGVPVSGLYINDMPGISLARAASATDENYLRGVDFLRANEVQAFELLKQDFKFQLTKDFELNTVLDVIQRKITFNGGEYLAIENTLRYAVVEDLLCDTMANLKINYISFYAKNAYPDFELLVIDGANTHTYTFDVVAGFNQHSIGLLIESGNAIVSYNANQVEIYESDCYKPCNKVCTCDGSSGYIQIKYYTGAAHDLLTTSIYNGLNINATLICDLDNLFCTYLDLFKFALQTKEAILIAEKYLSSDRANPYVIMAKADAERLLTQWKGGTDRATGFPVPSEYWKHFQTAYQQAKKHITRSGSMCLECDTFKTVHFIP